MMSADSVGVFGSATSMTSSCATTRPKTPVAVAPVYSANRAMLAVSAATTCVLGWNLSPAYQSIRTSAAAPRIWRGSRVNHVDRAVTDSSYALLQIPLLVPAPQP